MLKQLTNTTKSLIRFPKNLLMENYYCAEKILNNKFEKSLRNKQPLLVYQMGKVGSTTVIRTFQNVSELSMPIFHVHLLNPENIAKDIEIFYGKKQLDFFTKSGLYDTVNIFVSKFLRKKIERGDLSPFNKWKIITLVREPIARNISGFFEGFHLRFPDYYEKYGYDQQKFAEFSQMFINKYPHDTPLTWFDSELKLVFGVDVFDQEFPKSKGYKIYQEDSVDVLLLKLENLEQVFNEAVKDFLKLDQDITLIRGNISKDKNYYSCYREFLNKINLPKSYIDKMYDSSYSRHFYTQEEIDSFKEKWVKTKQKYR